MSLDDVDMTELATKDQPPDNDLLLAYARRTMVSLRDNVGSSERERHYEINAYIFLRELVKSHNGTFVWDGPESGKKFSHIWQALAAAMQDFAEKDWAGQHEHVEEYAPRLSKGFYSARSWYEEWYGGAIYSIPEFGVITLYPDYKLPNGLTAAAMQNNRDTRRAAGQLSASARRLAASGGIAASNVWTEEMLSRVREGMIGFQPTRAVANSGP